MKNGTKTIALNKKAKYDYFILKSFEAGIELFGTEVKSIRENNVNLKDSWCLINKNMEIFLYGMHISPYEKGSIFNRDPLRVRKLLLHKKEINYLFEQAKLQSLTIIPISLYFKKSLVKVQIALCKGKKNYDKREVLAKKSADIQIRMSLKNKF